MVLRRHQKLSSKIRTSHPVVDFWFWQEAGMSALIHNLKVLLAKMLRRATALKVYKAHLRLIPKLIKASNLSSAAYQGRVGINTFVRKYEPYSLKMPRSGAASLDEVPVVIRTPMRLGNFSVQLWNAVNVAEFIGSRQVLHNCDGLGNFAVRDVTVLHSEKKVNFGLRSDFYYGEILRTELYNIGYEEVCSSLLASIWPGLSFSTNATGFSSEATVTMHVRGGDVFSEWLPNPFYAQPPLSFYIRAVKSFPIGARFTVITDDSSGLVVSALLEWLSKQNCYQYDLAESSLGSAARAISQASSVICSRGTFMLPFIAAAGGSKRFIVDGEIVIPSCPVKFTHEIDIVELDYPNRFFIQDANRYWVNSSYQRNKLLTNDSNGGAGVC